MNSSCWQFDTPKSSKLAKICSLKFVCKKSYLSLNTCWIPTNEGSKLKLDFVESKNSRVSLMIDVLSFKLCLVDFVYFFDTPGIWPRSY